MDSLDSPLIASLRIRPPVEQYPDELEPATKPVGDSFNRYGCGDFRPTVAAALVQDLAPAPLSLDADRAGAAGARARRCEPVRRRGFRVHEPRDGRAGAAHPRLQYPARFAPRPHASPSPLGQRVYHVFRGAGYSVVDGVRIDWQAGDFFSLPPWCWHEHANPGPATPCSSRRPMPRRWRTSVSCRKRRIPVPGDGRSLRRPLWSDALCVGSHKHEIRLLPPQLVRARSWRVTARRCTRSGPSRCSWQRSWASTVPGSPSIISWPSVGCCRTHSCSWPPWRSARSAFTSAVQSPCCRCTTRSASPRTWRCWTS